jgi:hypothetical protein
MTSSLRLGPRGTVLEPDEVGMNRHPDPA